MISTPSTGARFVTYEWSAFNDCELTMKELPELLHERVYIL
jgi:hypothetical protein